MLIEIRNEIGMELHAELTKIAEVINHSMAGFQSIWMLLLFDFRSIPGNQPAFSLMNQPWMK